jgi:hypothetical protein
VSETREKAVADGMAWLFEQLKATEATGVPAKDYGRFNDFIEEAVGRAYEAGRLSGAEEERAAVVEYMRAMAEKYSGILPDGQLRELTDMAWALEQGAHRKAGKP